MKIEKCRICSSKKLEKFLDLGEQPWCNNFVTKDKVGNEAKYPLEVCFCQNCSTVQINYNVPKEFMYSDHLYLSGVTNTMRNHFQKVADKVCRSFVETKGLVVDIGSNDGTLLETYKKQGMNVLGVEPCSNIAVIARGKGIPTDIEFFNYDYAKNLVRNRHKAKVISAANVFYHIEELHSVVRGIKLLLDSDGIFVMHGSYLPDIIQKRAFDIMYHEHLLYYRVETLNYLLKLYDLEIFDIDKSPVHGGSIVVYICHRGRRKIDKTVEILRQKEINEGFHQINKYRVFSEHVKVLKKRLIELILELKNSGKTIYAFGAPAKGTVLLNYCRLTNKEIVIAVERNPLKFNQYIPGTNIQIVDENTVDEPDYYLMLPWNFAEEFCKSEAFLSGKRKFIVPIPEPKILER